MTGLGESFYERPVLEVARDLLGATVRHGPVAVRLTEVEAYAGPADPGSHAFRGPTPRTEVMFGPPGRLYVYFSYGMHHCMNLVCGPDGTASAVLLRAGEVVDGLDAARKRRTRPGRPAPSDRDLARGPARLTQALGLDRAHDGLDTTVAGAAVTITGREEPLEVGRILTGPRVGVSGPGGGDEFPWRFWVTGDPTVSVYRPAVVRRRNTA